MVFQQLQMLSEQESDLKFMLLQYFNGTIIPISQLKIKKGSIFCEGSIRQPRYQGAKSQQFKPKNFQGFNAGKMGLAATLKYVGSQYNLIRKVEMNSENIFIELQKWSKFLHPHEQLEDLKQKGSPDLIRNYFTSKSINGSVLRHISNAQLHKFSNTLRNSKFKMIYKEKVKKLMVRRCVQEGSFQLQAKSSSKTNIWSEQDQQVSQYLNFDDQELVPSLKST